LTFAAELAGWGRIKVDRQAAAAVVMSWQISQ
jgi:hypothetical protein